MIEKSRCQENARETQIENGPMNQTVNSMCHLPLTSSGFVAAARKDGRINGMILAIKGCMFSGKTTTLIATANMFYRCNVAVSIVAPDMSKRNENEQDTIRSHDGVMPMCLTTYVARDGLQEFCHRFVADRKSIRSDLDRDSESSLDGSSSSHSSDSGNTMQKSTCSTVLCIDEAQFFENLIQSCRFLRRNGVVVVVAGLTLTYERKPFLEMHRLLDFADECVERKAVCGRCKSWNATLTHRTSQKKGDVVVGGANEYMATCQMCFEALTEPDIE